MKRKINRYMLVLATTAISIALVTLSMVYYGSFCDQVLGDLSTTCRLLVEVYNAGNGEQDVSSAGESVKEKMCIRDRYYATYCSLTYQRVCRLCKSYSVGAGCKPKIK